MADYATAEPNRVIISWPFPALCTLADYLTPWLVCIFWMISNLYPDTDCRHWTVYCLNSMLNIYQILSPLSTSLSFIYPTLTAGWLFVSLSLPLMKAGKLSNEMMNWQNSWSRLSSHLGPGWVWLAECFSSHFPVQYSAGELSMTPVHRNLCWQGLSWFSWF